MFYSNLDFLLTLSINKRPNNGPPSQTHCRLAVPFKFPLSPLDSNENRGFQNGNRRRWPGWAHFMNSIHYSNSSDLLTTFNFRDSSWDIWRFHPLYDFHQPAQVIIKENKRKIQGEETRNSFQTNFSISKLKFSLFRPAVPHSSSSLSLGLRFSALIRPVVIGFPLCQPLFFITFSQFTSSSWHNSNLSLSHSLSLLTSISLQIKLKVSSSHWVKSPL